jgi:acyl carrier protein
MGSRLTQKREFGLASSGNFQAVKSRIIVLVARNACQEVCHFELWRYTSGCELSEQRRNVMRDELRTFITTELMRDPGYQLQDDEALISGGLIDSFSLVELQLFIEQQFGVFIDDTELTADAIDNMNDIIALIEARK